MNDDELGDTKDESEDWTVTSDRGGLKHVNNMTYCLCIHGVRGETVPQ